jgi:hypothetical protein
MLTVFFETQLSNRIEYPTSEFIVPTWPGESPSSCETR